MYLAKTHRSPLVRPKTTEPAVVAFSTCSVTTATSPPTSIPMTVAASRASDACRAGQCLRKRTRGGASRPEITAAATNMIMSKNKTLGPSLIRLLRTQPGELVTRHGANDSSSGLAYVVDLANTQNNWVSMRSEASVYDGHPVVDHQAHLCISGPLDLKEAAQYFLNV
jgi:hypothetical protein